MVDNYENWSVWFQPALGLVTGIVTVVVAYLVFWSPYLGRIAAAVTDIAVAANTAAAAATKLAVTVLFPPLLLRPPPVPARPPVRATWR
ncbi:hypothetical protein F4677DRAFT_458737 [Hypoxylon crocopeplum]|nr:hypothetical protein F4677DRAFT_458737 [Hypoxylon crocopeplum]